jgi:putative acetyltransferase
MILDKTVFRPSEPGDRLGIHALHRRAFGREEEAELVDALIDCDAETLSTVAQLDGMIVGHILLSALQGPERSLALAPLAVDPDWRDFLIGTELTRHAIAEARDAGWLSVFVLGDPVYYGRFGFRSETADPVRCPFQGSNYMALELVPDGLFGYAGEVRYPAPFGA